MGFRDKVSGAVKSIKHQRAMAQMKQAQTEAVKEKRLKAELNELNYKIKVAEQKARLQKAVAGKKKHLNQLRGNNSPFAGLDFGLEPSSKGKKKKQRGMFDGAFDFKL